MFLLSLPEEVLVIILSSLRASDILAFASVNKYANKFYSSSSRLQYIAELDAAGCLDPSLEALYADSSASEQSNPANVEKDGGSSKNTVPSTSISEKLAYLRIRENRWRELDLQRNAKKLPLKREIEVSIYDLSAGVFAFAENGRENILDFVELKEVSMHPGIQNEDERKELDDEPADEEESFFGTEGDRTILPSTAVPWQKFAFDAPVADFALSMKEHNLIVFVLYNPKERGNGVLNLPSIQEIKLHLLDFTTRTSHTLAKEPMIKLTEKPATYRRPSPAIEVAGKYIVIALTFPRSVVGTVIEDLFVINWHTGRIIHHQSFNIPTYDAIAFVTPSLLVLPNLRDNSLDLVHIFVNPNDTNGIEHVLLLRKLCLPELAPHFKLRSVVCRGDPNPTSSTPDILHPNQDVSTTSYKSEDRGSARYGITADPLRAIISFKFIIGPESAGVPYGPAVNFVIHRSTLVSFALDGLEHRKGMFLASLPSSHVNSESSHLGVSLAETGDVIPKIVWSSWGPGVTRWKLEEDFVDWVTTTAGQRQVLTSLSTEWQPGIVVRDYNPYEVRRVRERALSSRGGEMNGDRKQDHESKVKGKAKEGAEKTNPCSTREKNTQAREIRVHIDSVDGERDSDSEDEDELGVAGQLSGLFHGPLENQLATIEQISDMVALAPDPTSAPSPATTTAPVSVSAATSESSIPFPPSGASSSPSDLTPSSSSSAIRQPSAHAPASGPSGTSSLLQQLWIEGMEEGAQNGEGENGTSADFGAHEEIVNADVLMDYYTNFNAGEGAPTEVDHSQALQTLSPQTQAQPLRLTSIRIRDTTSSFKVRYYEAGQVQGGLPCVEYTIAGDESLYSGLLMDEDRIIGYKESAANLDRTDKMVQMCVFSMYP